MSVNNALAGVAARDLKASAKWYEQLIGSPGKQPMEEVFEWTLPGGGVLQVLEDAERAGSSSLTLSVTDLGGHVSGLPAQGVEIGDRTKSDQVNTAIVKDPDGNQAVLASHMATWSPASPGLARVPSCVAGPIDPATTPKE